MIISTSLEKCIHNLQQGGVVAFPTETSYGLLCNIYNEEAKKRIYQIKKRPTSKTFSVLVKDLEMASGLIHINNRIKKVFNEIYPGPLTIVAKAKKDISYISKNTSIALRVSSKREIQNMFNQLDFPLTATSANVSGNEDLYTASEVYQNYLDSENKPDIIFDDQEEKKRKASPSTIIDLTKNELVILRQGSLTLAEIEKAIN